MASRTIIELTDDLDGGKGAETVVFALDGRSYEIDLSAKNAKALRAALDTYVAAARRSGSRSSSRAGARGASRPPTRHTTAGYDPAAVRAWAASNKITVSSRGRIKAEVLEQYRAAGN
jgi:hypothetical protein